MDFFSSLTESQIGGAGVAVLVISVLLGVLKGVIRIILGLAGLAAAAAAFWFVFRNGEGFIGKFVAEPEAWMPLGAASGAASGAYLAVRHGVGVILKPLIGSVDALKNKKVLAGLMGLGLGGAGLYGGGSASHQVDAMSFLKERRRGEEVGWVSQVLSKAQESWFGNFQQNTDPSMTGYRCDLVKMLSLVKFDQGRARGQEVQSLVNTPGFRRLLYDPEISQALEAGDFQTLFRNEKLTYFLQTDGGKELLRRVDWSRVQ